MWSEKCVKTFSHHAVVLYKKIFIYIIIIIIIIINKINMTLTLKLVKGNFILFDITMFY